VPQLTTTITPIVFILWRAVTNIIAVPMSDGSVISLDAAASPSFVKTLKDGARKELVSQLSDLQSQLSSMMAKLGA